MSDQVTLQIDGVEVTVPRGTLVVDAAKRLNVDIPVFCYHPKMDPVGMCRMCLVEIGLPQRDRATGELVRDADGQVQINFGQVLQTGCTVPVSDGMVVRTATKTVTDARDDVLEFILTNHPLDCPVCDKGGECPLQNLTLRYGSGNSRYTYADKISLDKHVPLGDLIYLDRERCIQCARCTRFQSEIVADPVIGFHNRGRTLEIVTLSDPGFDSYWSGNTTDICPVGALTTADFRFGARPWEMTPVASLCTHCPVGCNLTLSTRREARSNGREVVKRVMPRQNEGVNEIWICDKGRFVHQFSEAPDRLLTPLIRRDGELEPATWPEVYTLIAKKLREHQGSVAGLAGDRLSNEDLFQFQKLMRQGVGTLDLDLAQPRMAGGDIVAQVGLASGSNLGDLGAGDVVIVAATDLHEEAPIWWLRVKQAAERGAKLIILNARSTRLDAFADHAIYYEPGQALTTIHQLVNTVKVAFEGQQDALQLAAERIAAADNVVAFYGREGLTYRQTDALARLLANLLLVKTDSDHIGRPNNGLIPVWPRANTQGAWDMGVHPSWGPGYQELSQSGRNAGQIYAAVADGSLKVLYVVGADPVGDGLLAGRGQLDLLIAQDLLPSKTAEIADIILPAQSWVEREGTFTNGERRVQRFYPAVPSRGLSRPDWQILAQIHAQLTLDKAPFAASLAFREIAQKSKIYDKLDYRLLSQTEKQWPDVGGEDLYYGGNAYENRSGLGVQWPARAEREIVAQFPVPDDVSTTTGGLQLMGIGALYQSGSLIERAELLASRVAPAEVFIHPVDANALAIVDGQTVTIQTSGGEISGVVARVTGDTPGLASLRGTPCPSGTLAAQIIPSQEAEREMA